MLKALLILALLVFPQMALAVCSEEPVSCGPGQVEMLGPEAGCPTDSFYYQCASRIFIPPDAAAFVEPEIPATSTSSTLSATSSTTTVRRIRSADTPSALSITLSNLGAFTPAGSDPSVQKSTSANLRNILSVSPRSSSVSILHARLLGVPYHEDENGIGFFGPLIRFVAQIFQSPENVLVPVGL